MNRAIQVGGLMLLVAAAALCDQNPPNAPPRGRNAAPLRPAPKNGGAARGGGLPKGPPPRLINPGNPVTRLYQATPEQRDRFLEKLPPAMQERMRRNLEDYDRLPKEQQQMRLRQAERFDALPREKQFAVRQQLQAINHLPEGRKQAVRQALRRLQMAPEEDRARFLNSEIFKNRFSPEEQKIISDLSEVFLPPI